MTARVLETRTLGPGVKRRRYERSDGSRYTTVEVPLTVLRSLGGAKRLEETVAAWHRGEQSRAVSKTRRARIETLLRQGVKPTAIAHEVGVSEQRVRQIRKSLAGLGHPTSGR